MPRPATTFWQNASGPTLYPGLNTREAVLLNYSEELAGVNINMLAYGLPTDGTTNCNTAIAAAMAANPGGGTMVFPPGTYRLTGHIDLTGAPYNIRGQGRYITTLWVTTDADDAVFVFRTDCGLLDVSLVGPAVANKDNIAAAPVKRGVILRDRSFMQNCHVEAFGKNIVMDGNHQGLIRVKSTNARHNLVWAQALAGYTTASAASFTHGNQTLHDVDLTGTGEASVQVAGDSKIDSSTWTQVHMGFGPHGMLFAPKTTQEMALGNSDMINCSFESCGSNYIEDLGWNTANRRLSSSIQWISPLTGGQDPAYAVGGVGGIEMVKLGTCQDWTIYGRVADDSNTSFGSVGWGTTTTACGYRFESCNGFTQFNADVLHNNSTSQGKPMFRLEGGQLAWNNVYFTIFKRYKCAVGLAAVTMVNETLVQPNTITNGDPWAQGFGSVKPADGTGPVIGRIIAANSITTAGYLIPICFDGAWSSPATVAANGAITAGTPLAIDPANPGKVKAYTAAGQFPVGTALAASSGGAIPAHLRFAWTQV